MQKIEVKSNLLKITLKIGGTAVQKGTVAKVLVLGHYLYSTILYSPTFLSATIQKVNYIPFLTILKSSLNCKTVCILYIYIHILFKLCSN